MNTSPFPAAVATAARQVLLVAGGWFIGRGYLNADTWEAISTVALIVVPLVYGQVKGWQRHRELTEAKRTL